jgi:brefeldin A-inhibited guanine nucleotide-exchange protein
MLAVFSRLYHPQSFINSETFENSHNHPDTDHDNVTKELTVNDLFIKDAFLVFRALCKLTMKPLNSERLAFFSWLVIF